MMSRIITPFAIRFASKVIKSDDPNACWGWAGSTVHGGYGCIREGGRNSKALRAHRVSYEIAFGPIPDGMCVLHRCDNPPCTNPAHLFLGTRVDNNADMTAKGRRRWVTTAGRPNLHLAKLTEDDVRAMRVEYAAGGISYRALAAKYGVTHFTVQMAVKRVYWAHIE